MSDNINRALVALDKHLNSVGVADSSGVASAEENAKNLSALELGPEIVDLTGVDRYVMPRGAGNGTMYAPRLALQPIQSKGPAILIKIPGTGAVDAKGSEITIGRVAVGPNDYAAAYSKAITTPITFNNDNSNYLNLPALTINVKCAAGVTTLIRAECAMELDPSNTATVIESSLSIGAGVSGEKWKDDADATESPVWKSAARGMAMHVHERLILGTAATERDGVVIVPRVRRTGGGAGSYNPSPTLGVGATVQVNGVTNIRSTAAIADDNILFVAPAGSVGTVASGPVNADGYAWYQCSITGVGAGYIASSQLTVTNNVAPISQINSIMNAQLTVWRIPV